MAQPSSSSLPDWPPELDAEQTWDLVHAARDYALSNSIVYRPVLTSTDTADKSQQQTAFHASVIHAPFSLFPTPFPRRAFQRAVSIQKLYNHLYAAIASDHAFLEKVIGGNVAQVDDFQRELWNIAKLTRQEGQPAQDIHLGLFRSDYLLHDPSIASSTPSLRGRGDQNGAGEISFKQVEFNTISSSFGALSAKVSGMHRFLAQTQAQYYDMANPPITLQSLPENPALQELARGLKLAHDAYGVEDAQILFVVQDPERNAFDQRALEWELLQVHGIKVQRLSFQQLASRASLSASKQLLIESPFSQSSKKNIAAGSNSDSKAEIAVVYFRAGYTPNDYPTSKEWETRLLLERSRAINCPSVPLQLAGAKKIQQVLTEPGVLESFGERLNWNKEEEEEGNNAIERLRETFVDMYPLDESSELGRTGLKLAYEHPERFVLKPQREGGGNNVYRGDIPGFLDELARSDSQRRDQGKGQGQGSPKAHEGYILMSLIQPPEGLKNALVRAGDLQPKIGEVVSELGIYGVCLYRAPSRGGRDGQEGRTCEILHNNMAGHLLRTKGRESDEGGVAVGFSVVDSPFLVD